VGGGGEGGADEGAAVRRVRRRHGPGFAGSGGACGRRPTRTMVPPTSPTGIEPVASPAAVVHVEDEDLAHRVHRFSGATATASTPAAARPSPLPRGMAPLLGARAARSPCQKRPPARAAGQRTKRRASPRARAALPRGA
jgi:hypothetical protein